MSISVLVFVPFGTTANLKQHHGGNVLQPVSPMVNIAHANSRHLLLCINQAQTGYNLRQYRLYGIVAAACNPVVGRFVVAAMSWLSTTAKLRREHTSEEMLHD